MPAEITPENRNELNVRKVLADRGLELGYMRFELDSVVVRDAVNNENGFAHEKVASGFPYRV